MQKFVAEQNIQHFKEMLARESNPQQRAALEAMIGEEEAKLSDIASGRAAEASKAAK